MFENFTQNTEILVDGLLPFTEYEVFVQSSLVDDDGANGRFVNVSFWTAVGGENSEVESHSNVRSNLGDSDT